MSCTARHDIRSSPGTWSHTRVRQDRRARPQYELRAIDRSHPSPPPHREQRCPMTPTGSAEAQASFPLACTSARTRHGRCGRFVLVRLRAEASPANSKQSAGCKQTSKCLFNTNFCLPDNSRGAPSGWSSRPDTPDHPGPRWRSAVFGRRARGVRRKTARRRPLRRLSSTTMATM